MSEIIFTVRWMPSTPARAFLSRLRHNGVLITPDGNDKVVGDNGVVYMKFLGQPDRYGAHYFRWRVDTVGVLDDVNVEITFDEQPGELLPHGVGEEPKVTGTWSAKGMVEQGARPRDAVAPATSGLRKGARR